MTLVTQEILAISDASCNAELIVHCRDLGYITGRVLDLTYGEGKFWTLWQPDDLLTNDLNPDKGQYHYDFRGTPWGSRDFETVVLDPPYKLAGKRFNDDLDQRYGIETYVSRADVTALLVGGCKEAARLSSRWVLVKCMDQVNAGKVRWQTDDVTAAVCGAGFEKRDALFLKRWRPQPEGRGQKTARRNYSTLLIFERSNCSNQSLPNSN